MNIKRDLSNYFEDRHVEQPQTSTLLVTTSGFVKITETTAGDIVHVVQISTNQSYLHVCWHISPKLLGPMHERITLHPEKKHDQSDHLFRCLHLVGCAEGRSCRKLTCSKRNIPCVTNEKLYYLNQTNNTRRLELSFKLFGLP